MQALDFPAFYRLVLDEYRGRVHVHPAMLFAFRRDHPKIARAVALENSAAQGLRNRFRGVPAAKARRCKWRSVAGGKACRTRADIY